jgi:osmoprotectant transport system permease protein
MQYLFNNFGVVASRFGEHLRLTAIALLIALLIALPLGVLIHRIKWLESPIMSLLNMLYTIPSLALLVLLVPFLGLGANTAIVVLVIYAQVILVRNILVGLNGVNPDIVEAARGMGMNGWQRFFKIEVPLALPVMIAGLLRLLEWRATVAIRGDEA